MEIEGEKASKKSMGRVEERPYWLLLFSVFVRAAHQVGAAVFLTSFIFKDMVLSDFYLVLVIASGIVLVGTEFMRHRQLYCECAGVVTIVKVLLLGAAFHEFIPGMPTVVFVFILASVGAHMPKKIRHRLLF